MARCLMHDMTQYIGCSIIRVMLDLDGDGYEENVRYAKGPIATRTPHLLRYRRLLSLWLKHPHDPCRAIPSSFSSRADLCYRFL